MDWNGFRQRRPETCRRCRLPGQRREPVVVQAVAGQGSDDIRAAVLDQPGVQRVGVLDVLLGDVVGKPLRRKCESAAAHDRTGLERVAVVGAHRDVLVRLFEIGELEARDQLDRGESVVAAPLERWTQCPQLLPGREPVEAAHAHVHRVDRTTSDRFHDGVACLLQAQPLLDDVGVLLRHLDGTGVAEEVGRMQQVDVQGVALDPLAAVEQSAERSDLLGHRDSAGVLQGQAGTHLVGDRTDAADARRDVRRLREGAPAEKSLEEPRRLVDAQLRRRSPARRGHGRASLLRPRLGRACRHAAAVRRLRPCASRQPFVSVETDSSWRSPSRRNGSAAALNVRKMRVTSRSGMPRKCSRSAMDEVFGVPFGPKQP